MGLKGDTVICPDTGDAFVIEWDGSKDSKSLSGDMPRHSDPVLNRVAVPHGNARLGIGTSLWTHTVRTDD